MSIYVYLYLSMSFYIYLHLSISIHPSIHPPVYTYMYIQIQIIHTHMYNIPYTLYIILVYGSFPGDPGYTTSTTSHNFAPPVRQGSAQASACTSSSRHLLTTRKHWISIQRNQVFYMVKSYYPLVNIQKAIENGHL